MMTNTTPNRRRFRFSLRTLLVLTAVVCILLGWKTNKVHRQRQAVEAIRPHARFIFYDYQCDANGKPLNDAKFPDPPGPAWFRKLAGEDFFARVLLVRLDGPDFVNASVLSELPHLRSVGLFSTGVTDLNPLVELRNLEVLVLNGSAVSDISPLSEMRKLRILNLTGTKVTDFSPLLNLKRLEELIVVQTQVRDISVLRNLTELAQLDLVGTQVIDLSPLSSLPKLSILHIDDTPVSEEEIEELQRALPKLTVHRFRRTPLPSPPP